MVSSPVSSGGVPSASATATARPRPRERHRGGVTSAAHLPPPYRSCSFTPIAWCPSHNPTAGVP
ncbi:hypothetical protein SXIM_35330 [Streptomyces xiamenensis]|uniref:Uncharacterized protein n=1 Tax=Streptomyces xiamenensis TaxID=408015 RepID=A0A0F7FWW6_9ACTN|nr:hypothetical protein SXIM_35330 [Streptomyces xiamenensis]